MQFYSYKPFWSNESRREFLDLVRRSPDPQITAGHRANHARAETAWVFDRRPFYRFWPGLFYALSKVDLTQIKIKNLQFTLPDELHSIVVEFPKGIPYDDFGIKSSVVENGEKLPATALTTLLIYQSNPQSVVKGLHGVRRDDIDDKGYLCVLCEEDEKGLRCHTSGILFNKDHLEMPVRDYLDSRKFQTVDGAEYLHFASRMLVLLSLLSNDDKEVFERIVLARDKDKFDPADAEKFWDRAKRNGMYGWDLGKSIPTPEELEEYKATGRFRGKMMPHFRSGHFSRRWTGEGRTVLKWVWIHETIVNKHLATKIPEGFHDQPSPDENLPD